MEEIRKELNLLTDESLSRRLTKLLEDVDEETLIALEEVRKRRSIGMGLIFRAAIFARTESQINDELSNLFTYVSSLDEEPPAVTKEIAALKAQLRDARKSAFRKGRRTA